MNRMLWALLPLTILPLGCAGPARAARPEPADASAAAGKVARPPNVVLILIDDLGWADLSCYGSTFHETPELDRLAAGGTRFTRAYAAAPLCSPTRAAILTGKHPARLHLTTYLPGRPDNPAQKLLHPKINQHLPSEEVTLAEALKPAGYRCGHVGKWHLGGKGFSPIDQGFDTSALTETKNTPEQVTAEAERFIEESRDRPFFLYVCHSAVHIPLAGKPDLVAKYTAKSRPGQGLGQEQNNPTYAAMLEGVDQGVGRIVRKLETLGLSENTLVLFTSDNGGLAIKEGPNTPATSNAPLRGAKGQLFEGGIRVPLIAYRPGSVPAGKVCDVPVNSADYFPTLLNLAGVEAPPGPRDGVDISALLAGEERGLAREAMFWHLPHYSNQGGTPTSAVRRGDFKLIEFFEDDRVELYNLAEDGGENRDLSREMPGRRNELRTLLRQWRDDVGAQMPTPNPDYDPDWKRPGRPLDALLPGARN